MLVSRRANAVRGAFFAHRLDCGFAGGIDIRDASLPLFIWSDLSIKSLILFLLWFINSIQVIYYKSSAMIRYSPLVDQVLNRQLYYFFALVMINVPGFVLLLLQWIGVRLCTSASSMILLLRYLKPAPNYAQFLYIFCCLGVLRFRRSSCFFGPSYSVCSTASADPNLQWSLEQFNL